MTITNGASCRTGGAAQGKKSFRFWYMNEQAGEVYRSRVWRERIASLDHLIQLGMCSTIGTYRKGLEHL